jgi:hypothetical protein
MKLVSGYLIQYMYHVLHPEIVDVLDLYTGIKVR